MHHLSLAVRGREIAAAELCDILTNLEAAGGYNLSELLTRLASAMESSSQIEETADLALRGKLAAVLTRKAAEHAQQVALCLETAHSEIAASLTAPHHAAAL